MKTAVKLYSCYYCYYYSTAKTTKNSLRFTIGLDRRLSDDWRRLHHDSTTDKAKSSASGSQETTEERHQEKRLRNMIEDGGWRIE